MVCVYRFSPQQLGQLWYASEILLDLVNENSVTAAVLQAINKFGNIDIVVNNHFDYKKISVSRHHFLVLSSAGIGQQK